MVKTFPQEWYTFDSAEQWRAWLMENHEQRGEVWLRIRKAHAKTPGIVNTEAVLEALCFGWIDSHMRPQDSDGYLLRFSPRRKGSSWSPVNRERAEQLIAEERMTAAGLRAIEEAKANGKWEAAAKDEEGS